MIIEGLILMQMTTSSLQVASPCHNRAAMTMGSNVKGT